MTYTGTFKSNAGTEYSVNIQTASANGVTAIGEDGGDFQFADSPVRIECEANDTTDTLVRHSATVVLLAREWHGEFFSNGYKDARVTIRENEEIIFTGYIEPQVYTQGYDDVWDEITLNCLDILSATQYALYKGVGSPGADYAALREASSRRTLLEIITEITAGVAGYTPRIFYDNSKRNATSGASALSTISIGDGLFFGDDKDDTWTEQEVLEECLHFLGLHMEQRGADFFIYSLETLRLGDVGRFSEVSTGEEAGISAETITLRGDMVASSEASIDVGDTYSRIEITHSTKEMTDAVESPLASDALSPIATGKQLYITEFFTHGSGKTSRQAFFDITHGRKTDFKDAEIVRWYIRTMRCRSWTFHAGGGAGDLIEQQCPDGRSQHNVPNSLRRQIGAAVIATGKEDVDATAKDDSKTARISMENCLYVSVNGNGVDYDSSKPGEIPHPTEAEILAAAPVAEYTGADTVSVLSPADSSTTRYIVISGKIILNPLTGESMTYAEALAMQSADDIYGHVSPTTGIQHMPIPGRKNNDRWYTRAAWTCYYPSSTPSRNDADAPLLPYTGADEQQYEFQYSSVGSSSDNVSKIGILQCMLIVGEKCAVENGARGEINDIVWRAYKSRTQCSSDDEYYAQSFSIGFNPKIGDKLIGTEYDIQNNISHTMGVDAEGTAIPVRSSDRLSGRVRFMILGPANFTWGDITRRHGSFWRHTQWTTHAVPLLAHVSSVVLKSFEIKVYDDSTTDIGDGGDIVYASDTDERFVNVLDVITNKIGSDTTAAERQSLGISGGADISVAVDEATGLGLLSVRDANAGLSDKPERIYVDELYREWHDPRICLSLKLKNMPQYVNRWAHYVHPNFQGKVFVPQGVSMDLEAGVAEIRIKEVEHD